MNLYAISDLHIANKINKEALSNLKTFNNDWLILAGDIGETIDHLEFTLTTLKNKFKQIIWAPGNHDLWTYPLQVGQSEGEDKYNCLVEICRKYDVATPEDEFLKFKLNSKQFVIAPTFTLYDYSFGPNIVPYTKIIDWAADSGVICTDEYLLKTYPYNSIKEWCQKRCEFTELRLSKIPKNIPIIIVNHFPIIAEHARTYHFPRFSIWCGTKRTENWLKNYNIKIVIYGHMHIRSTKRKNGVRFEEVSLGYPKDWNYKNGLGYYLRKIKHT